MRSTQATQAEVKAAKAAFNAAVDEILGQAIAISNERGGEYADSWALENQQTRFLDMVMREIEARRSQFTELQADEKRLIMVAALCDVKMSRMIGGFKGDTLDDLINYVAALRKWLGDYVMREEQAIPHDEKHPKWKPIDESSLLTGAMCDKCTHTATYRAMLRSKRNAGDARLILRCDDHAKGVQA